jgi:CheY-like chemotaxis protein
MAGTEASQDRTPSQLATAQGTPPKVAIVGGSESSAMVAEMLCRQFGCKAIAAPTGEAVLGLLRTDTRVDLVLIDLSVSDMDGIVVVQLIRAMGNRGTLPVVAMVADKTALASNRARGAGLAGVVVKPYSPRELFTAMRAALARAAQRALHA